MSKSLHSEFLLPSTVPVGVLLALWHLLTHPLECFINIFMSYAKLTLSHCHLQVFLSLITYLPKTDNVRGKGK